ncbi:hypothetical protein CHARACLAT_003037 [Characodon lateralis]|uniref:Liver-expressed antimicrobial peptide 2 n=1 Tax=Characodon lateralis TaxID=208331 RepID=A0ABU7D4B9_9TELE|nr:hypothetical protein [Characodon lateralis]
MFFKAFTRTRTHRLLLYPGLGHVGSRLGRHTQTSLSPDSSSSSSRGAQSVPRQAERHSPSSVSWAVPWASSRWDVPGTPPEEGIQEASGIDARATSTGSSRCGGAAALLRAPHPISKGVPGHPKEEAHFSRLYPGCCSFGHDPKFMAIDEGRNIDRSVSTLPVPENWNGLIQRTKRSLLWRWNSLKPVGASCRDPSECGTTHCRKNICSF